MIGMDLTGSGCGTPDLYIANESYNTWGGPVIRNYQLSPPVSINNLTSFI